MDYVLYYCLYIFRCISNVYIEGCPPGFDYLPEVDTCFTLISEAITWYNATKRCRQMTPGSHLAAITSQKENDAIKRYLQLQSSSKWMHVESRNCDYTAKFTIYQKILGQLKHILLILSEKFNKFVTKQSSS